MTTPIAVEIDPHARAWALALLRLGEAAAASTPLSRSLGITMLMSTFRHDRSRDHARASVQAIRCLAKAFAPTTTQARAWSDVRAVVLIAEAAAAGRP